MKTDFLLNGIKFSCTHGDNTRVNLTHRKDGEIDYYKFECDFGELRMPEKITLKYLTETKNVYSWWNAAKKDRHIPFGENQGFYSRLACWMPLMQTVSKDDKNCSCVAVKDVKTPIACDTHIDIYSEQAETSFVFFNGTTNPTTHYETEIRVDNRTIPFEDAIYSAIDWYSCSRTKRAVPEKAYSPMYSTWYSYLQNISAEAVLNECREAKKYGMDAVILDDGWQTDDPTVMYGYTGDWRPTQKKFPDMRKMVDELHKMGVAIIVWFSVPFMGYFSENHERFKGKYLTGSDEMRTSILDPRYKEVRDFLIETYVNALQEWDLDGLKLDFIDRFCSNGVVTPEMDYTSVEDATEKLLQDVSEALHRIKPDVLIEFRQPYMGPVITECGNMVRVWDCPLDPLYNRLGAINLRLTSGNCAVHADMINWARNDTPENVGARLFGTIFSVPQISARMNEISDEQKAALKNYLDCYNANKEVLMKGKLTASDPDSNYSMARTTLNGKTFAVGFCKNVFDVSGCTDAVLVNLTSEKEIIVKNADGYNYSVIDCMGNVIDTGKVCGNLTSLAAPLSSRAELKK